MLANSTVGVFVAVFSAWMNPLNFEVLSLNNFSTAPGCEYCWTFSGVNISVTYFSSSLSKASFWVLSCSYFSTSSATDSDYSAVNNAAITSYWASLNFLPASSSILALAAAGSVKSIASNWACFYSFSFIAFSYSNNALDLRDVTTLYFAFNIEMDIFVSSISPE